MSALGRRRLVERAVGTLSLGALLVALAPLVSIVATAVRRASFERSTLEIAGRALFGSAQVVGAAALVGVPLGVLTAVYASELGSARRARVVRTFVDVLAGVPPIVLGLAVYVVAVSPLGGFSVAAGSLALALVVLPIVARGTEDLLSLVPSAVRDAGLGLGVARWRVIALVLLRGVLPGMMSVSLLAIARAFGELAPLLFTVATSRWLRGSLVAPSATLPVEIYEASSRSGTGEASALTLLLLVVVLLLGLSARVGSGGRRG